MTLLNVLILAVLQGLTEFLPVSSSGHIVVAGALVEQPGVAPADTLALNIFLHLGTLGAILVVYRRRLWRLLGPDFRVALRVLVATLPAACVGLLAKDQVESVFQCPMLVGAMLLVTGLLLVASIRFPGGSLTCNHLPYWKALLVGIFQAVAILPGISRSGATIVAGLACGLEREESAAFSFLTAVPAIAGAGLLETMELAHAPSASTPWGLLLVGTAASFLVGLLALVWLICWVRGGRLYWFAGWVVPLGIAVLAWQFLAA